MPRTPWLDQAADELVAALSSRGRTLSHGSDREVIDDRIRAVAAAMSFSTQAARRYFDAELLADAIANQAQEFAANLTSPTADTRLSVGMAGRVVAALAESARWWQRRRPTHESAPVIAHISSLLSELGQVMEDQSHPGVGLEALVVTAPGLKGVSMLLRETVDAVNVDTVDDGLDQTTFANALRRDADLLTRLAE